MNFDLLTNPLLLVVLIVAVVLHEYAHAYVADKWGDHTARLEGRLTLNPFRHLDFLGTIAFLLFGIGWAKPVPVDFWFLRRKGGLKAMVSVVLAGPGVNLLLAVLGLYLSTVVTTYAGVSVTFSYLNFALALFNLLPFPPLDGGRVVVFVLEYLQRLTALREVLESYGIWLLLIFLYAGGSETFFNLVLRLWLSLAGIIL